MRIAVNTRFLLPGKLEGIGVFSHESLRRITQNNPQHEFIFFFDRPYDPSFIYSENIIPEHVFPPARHPVLWYWWFEWSLPKILKKYNPDVFLSPDGYLSLSLNIPTVPVIHDLAFEHYPDAIPWMGEKYYKHFFPKYAKKAKQIATVSTFSKKDIIKKYDIEPDKIDVVYNGANEQFHPLGEEEKRKVRANLTDGKEYFVYVGALHQRKNIENLLKSFDLFKAQTGSGMKLVIIGRKAWGNKIMEEVFQTMTYRDEVIFTGNVSQDELLNYIGAARALTYLSYFEGFGIPLVEAMYCDVPVITSNRSSLPEVAGEAGLICDPFDVVEIADNMKKMAGEEEVRNNLIDKVRVQKQKFSWDKTAERLWNVVNKAANS